MRAIVKRATVVVGLVAAMLAVLVPGAMAGSNASPATIKGTQIPIDESKGIYEMRGGLVGKWTVTAFAPHYQTSSQLAATGKEKFAGCHDTSRNGTCEASEPTGTMRFTFAYWATFDPTTKALVRGQCVHPVLGGTGDFASAKGVIHMKDTPAGSGVRTTYTGTLEYAGSTTASAGDAQPSRTLASRSAARCCGS